MTFAQTIKPVREQTGEVVATYPTYKQAQETVDRLSDESFPVQFVSIIANGLRMVERVTGRWSWARAALSGIVNGAIVGALVGMFLGLFALVDPLLQIWWFLGYGAMWGGVAGLVIGVVGYAFNRGNRDFRSVQSLEAETFDVVVHPQYVEQARSIIHPAPRAG